MEPLGARHNHSLELTENPLIVLSVRWIYDEHVRLAVHQSVCVSSEILLETLQPRPRYDIKTRIQLQSLKMFVVETKHFGKCAILLAMEGEGGSIGELWQK